ncbi:hypothetical protein Acr_00g0097930 [Actinidia rufa]|uniref:Uncharacterized protein n=1 Tax=Actinidia rufa TaxID=165716 RepID=A0A7J0DZC3_9ERIC|nr:hypothetical protein Acr_00g0097930 [Actinidia rufa]
MVAVTVVVVPWWQELTEIKLKREKEKVEVVVMGRGGWKWEGGYGGESEVAVEVVDERGKIEEESVWLRFSFVALGIICARGVILVRCEVLLDGSEILALNQGFKVLEQIYQPPVGGSWR